MWSFFHRTRIRKISRYQDQMEEFQPTGNHCFTSPARFIFSKLKQRFAKTRISELHARIARLSSAGNTIVQLRCHDCSGSIATAKLMRSWK